VQTYFCAVEFPEYRWQSQTIFSSKDYEKTANARVRGNERNDELQTGNPHRMKAARVSADTDSTSTGKDG
jgi:hypothetical protein